MKRDRIPPKPVGLLARQAGEEHGRVAATVAALFDRGIENRLPETSDARSLCNCPGRATARIDEVDLLSGAYPIHREVQVVDVNRVSEQREVIVVGAEILKEKGRC